MTASNVTTTELSCLGAKIKCVHDIASLIMMTVEGHKIIIGVLPTEYYSASNGVKRNYAGSSFNISYRGVMRMFL